MAGSFPSRSLPIFVLGFFLYLNDFSPFPQKLESFLKHNSTNHSTVLPLQNCSGTITVQDKWRSESGWEPKLLYSSYKALISWHSRAYSFTNYFLTTKKEKKVDTVRTFFSFLHSIAFTSLTAVTVLFLHLPSLDAVTQFCSSKIYPNN